MRTSRRRAPAAGAGTGALQVRSWSWQRWLWIAAVLSLVVVGLRFASSPAPLTVSDETLAVATPVDRPVYVGVLSGADAGDRALKIRDVRMQGGRDGVTVAPLICRGGTIGVTTSPHTFCRAVPVAVGNTVDLGAGDQLILRLQSGSAGSVTLGRTQVAYRDGLQWATQPAGPPIRVAFLAR